MYHEIKATLASVSVGVAAGKALAVVKTHFAKEDEFVFPPLGILPTLAKGQITSDMGRQ